MQEQREFEREIADDFSEERNELRVDQVTPAYSEHWEALIRVRPGAEDEARLVHMELSERVQGVVALLEGEALRRECPRLGLEGVFVRVGHTSDRTYAGYANIYRGIKALAPYLEDARFFISEMYSTWVDEYRIEGGALDPDSAPAWQRKARALTLLGRRGEAEACFERALALAPDPGLRQELALLAFGERRDRDAAAQLERTLPEQRSKLAWQVLGLLGRRAADDAAAAAAFDAALARGVLNPDNEALLRTGRVDDVLAAFWERAEQRLREGTGSLEHVVADMVHWAEFFRIKMHHGHDAPASRQRALALYDRAIALGDPGGAAHYWKGMLYKLTGGKAEAEAWLRAAAERGKAEALGELGSLLLERKQFDEAAALLREYLARTTGGYERGVRANQLLGALYEKANHLLDVVRDYRAAEAAFDAVIELQKEGSWSLQSFEGAWVGKSNARAWLGDHAGALACAERALELNAKSTYAWSAKGSALNNLRRFYEAMPCYDKAIEADPKYWHPYYCKACTLALTGGELRAIVALLREFLQRAPERRSMLRSEPDFAWLRGLAEFDALAEDGAPAQTEKKKKKK